MRTVDEFYLGANDITIAYILNNTRKDSRLQWMFLAVESSAALEWIVERGLCIHQIFLSGDLLVYYQQL